MPRTNRFWPCSWRLHAGCLLIICGCSHSVTDSSPLTLGLFSADFSQGGNMPKSFTCDGGDHSPALAWKAPPPGTESFALIADDPDAPVGTWVHWVLFDLPSDERSLPQNFPKNGQTADGSRQGSNDFDKIGYGGPCPPSGNAHRYFFKLYALDAKLNLNPGSTKKDVVRAMQGHILARAKPWAATPAKRVSGHGGFIDTREAPGNTGIR